MKIIKLCVFSIIFFIGILFILRSFEWQFSTYKSLSLTGTIISIFGAMGILCELYFSKKQ